MAPTLVTACTTLPPKGALAPSKGRVNAPSTRGGPAVLK
jgi:hypothetical protein